MRARLVQAILLGIVAELVASGLAYGIYRVCERIPLYALFYVPLHDRIFQPLMVRLGWTSRSVEHLGLCALVALNSLKWAGDILLFQNRRWILAGLLTTLLLAMIFVSISLEGIPI